MNELEVTKRRYLSDLKKDYGDLLANCISNRYNALIVRNITSLNELSFVTQLKNEVSKVFNSYNHNPPVPAEFTLIVDKLYYELKTNYRNFTISDIENAFNEGLKNRNDVHVSTRNLILWIKEYAESTLVKILVAEQKEEILRKEIEEDNKKFEQAKVIYESNINLTYTEYCNGVDIEEKHDERTLSQYFDTLTKKRLIILEGDFYENVVKEEKSNLKNFTPSDLDKLLEAGFSLKEHVESKAKRQANVSILLMAFDEFKKKGLKTLINHE